MKFSEHPLWDEVDWRCAELGQLVDSPRECLAALVQYSATLSDDRLCQLGVFVVEPLVNTHGEAMVDEFETALREHASLRKALSCAWLDVDKAIEKRLRDLVRPDENIGRQKHAEVRKPKWRRL